MTVERIRKSDKIARLEVLLSRSDLPAALRAALRDRMESLRALPGDWVVRTELSAGCRRFDPEWEDEGVFGVIWLAARP